MATLTDSNLLAYFVSTDPSTFIPQQISQVTVAIAPGITNQVQCEKIVFTVPYGGTDDIFSDKPTAESLEPESGNWQLTSSNIVDTGYSIVITLTSSFSGDTVTKTSSFQLSGTIQNFTAASSIKFVEYSQNYSSGRPTFNPNNGKLTVQPPATVGAASSALAIHKFMSYAPPTPPNTKLTKIQTAFAADDYVALVWKVTGATSTTIYAGNTVKNVSLETTTISYKLTRTTTFTLMASDKTGQTVTRTLTCTVYDPVLEGLDVTGNTVLGEKETKPPSTLTINTSATSTAGMTVNNGFTSTNDATISGALNVTGAITANNTLSVTEAVTLADTAVGGALSTTGAATLGSTLNVADATTLADTTVDGALTVNGAGITNLNGVTNAFGALQSAYSNQFKGTAKVNFNGNVVADSLVILQFDSSSITTGDICQVTLLYNQATFYVYYDQYKSNTNFFTIPIPNNQNAKNKSGDQFQLTVDYQQGDGKLKFNCYVVPLGTAAGVSIITPSGSIETTE